MRLDCALLYVKDLPRMKDFYGKMLRAQVLDGEPADMWAAFEVHGVRIALHAIPAGDAGDIEISSPPGPREGNPVKLIFAVDDVEAERTRLEAMGVTMLRRPWQRPSEACDGIDPEGNVFQISRSIFGSPDIAG